MYLIHKNYQCLLSLHGNQNLQHPENDKKKLEAQKQDGSCQKIKSLKEKEIKLISNNEVDE